MSAYGYDSPSPADGDQGRYSAESWEQTRREARASEAPQRPASRSHSPATLVPGIVRMSLRGGPADVAQVVAAIERAGAKVWRGDSPGTTAGNQVGFSYFTVQILAGDGDG